MSLRFEPAVGRGQNYETDFEWTDNIAVRPEICGTQVRVSEIVLGIFFKPNIDYESEIKNCKLG